MYLDRHTCENGGRVIKWVQEWRWGYHLMNAIASPFGKFRRKYPEFTVKTAILHLFFVLLFMRELALGLGMISCSAKSLNYELSRPEGGHIVILMPGGATEACNSQLGKYKFVVKSWNGFVKVALRNGSPLVPVISFGETDLFEQLEGRTLHKIQEFFKKYLGFAPVIINGRGFFQYSFGIIPRRKPVTTVVGAPIEITKIANPTNEQVEELHRKFVQSLTALFEEYKYKYLESSDDKHLELQ
ncbi:2-acylglycerol O-acyltransferase 1-like [Tenebrio molitor]|uniref:2-acylglycerol O-acyltransferase 1-like n=1 Tax=Tenebrio molitor TaxID=7067 RepID=UPI003624816E